MSAFAIAGGYTEVRDFVSDDYVLNVTVAGVNLTGYTLAGHLYQAGGSEIVGAVSVAITSASAGQFTATIAGQNLLATTYYGPYLYQIIRTDPGFRTVLAWGQLSLDDPSQI